MAAENSGKYSGVAMALHWLVAIAVIVTWLVTQQADAAPTREARGEILGTHFALGVVIFTLVVVRFAWRLKNSPPAQNASHAGWERALAKGAHLAIYTLLIVMPIAGWFAKSKFGSGIEVFGLFEVPPLPVAADPDGGKAIFETHALAGKILVALIVLHILAVLKHTLLDKDGTIFRMLPFGRVNS